jgi:CheY-like chemotaxis protein
LLGTEVHVRSAPGKGSTFSLRLPIAAHDDTFHASTALPAKALVDADKHMSVLIVDDDPIALAGTRTLLTELGCRVRTATDASSAEAEMTRLADAPLLVLCDLWLFDDRSGIRLLQRLRRRARGPFCGVLVSGDTRPETIELATDAGFALLHKPVAAARVQAIVLQFAERCRAVASEPSA